MANILLTAENFAFGPIGKLLVVAELLREQGHVLTFVGFGTSLQLAKKFPFTKVYELDTDNPSNSAALKKITRQTDVLISSMDIPSLVIAKQLGKLTIWIDCLFWFWDSIPNPVLKADLFIRERSLKDNKNKLKFELKIKNMFDVGPIIGKMADIKRKKQVLVSYGGGEATYSYRIGRDTNFPFVMTKIFLDYVDLTQFDKIIVATNEHATKDLEEKFPQAPFEFTCLSYDKFLKELSQSELILITPGLVTSEAAFYSGTPTIFLPASNNSQYLQLKEFRERGLAPASVHMSDFMTRLHLEKISIMESTKPVLAQLRQLEHSSKLQAGVGTAIDKLVYKRRGWSTKFVINGQKFIDSLGGNGAQAATDKIVQFLATKKIK
ncbi:MAG: hypothetical protein AAB521_00020 [Patescibacteria group bacterium]